MTAGIFGALAGDPITLLQDSGWLLGKIPKGTETYIQNAGFVWLLLLVPLAFAGWFGMNNLATDEVTPNPGSPIGAMIKIAGMLIIGFITAAAGLYIILPAPMNGAPGWAKWFHGWWHPVRHRDADEDDPGDT